MSRRGLLVAVLCLGATLTPAAEDTGVSEKQLRQELARQPGSLDLRFQLARTLGVQQRYAEALAEYSRLVTASPKNVDFLLGLAQIELWRGQPERALPPLRKARRLAPGYEDVWRTQIQALLVLGDADRMQQASVIRGEARGRFPRSDWSFARLDAPVVAAAPIVPIVPMVTNAPIVPSVAEIAPPTAAPAPVVAIAATTPAPIVETAPTKPALPRSQATPERRELEVGVSDEALTRGLGNWRSRYVLGEWLMTNRRTIYGGLRETERYRLTDREIHFGGMLPLQTQTDLQIEAGTASPHHVLSARYGMFQFHFKPGDGWALVAGLRRSIYDTGASRVINLGIDRYVGNERFAYTLYAGGPDGAGLAPSHRLQWAHYYGERDWLGVTLTSGRETEYVGNGSFLTSQVRSASLSGRHGFAPGWALTWEAGGTRQGDFYSRRGLRLGLRHAF